MNKKRIILISLVVLSIGILIIAALGYFVFSRRAADAELVFPATEVGSPVGDKVTKAIGPEGGSITSPDGRMTLTVPANALTETVPFSIQPVTNKFEDGLGLSYRLEPNGMAFTTPLEISFHYDVHDLEGTILEALVIGYQDNVGAWHVQREIGTDEDKKTLTLSATHFTDYTMGYVLGLSPSKATVHVGESVTLAPTLCNKYFIDELKQRFFGEEPCGPEHYTWTRWGGAITFELVGEGHLKMETMDRSGLVVYTAPAKKPTPNIAIVWFKNKDFDVFIERPCEPWEGAIAGKNDEKWVPRKHCYRRVPGPGSVKSVITIVDRGYKVSGNAGGDTILSGDICDLAQHFVLRTTNPFLSSVEFNPSSATDGRWSFSTKNGVTGGGEGTYRITGTDAIKTGIEMDGFSTGRGLVGPTLSGSGQVHLALIPLDTECKP